MNRGGSGGWEPTRAGCPPRPACTPRLGAPWAKGDAQILVSGDSHRSCFLQPGLPWDNPIDQCYPGTATALQSQLKSANTSECAAARLKPVVLGLSPGLILAVMMSLAGSWHFLLNSPSYFS